MIKKTLLLSSILALGACTSTSCLKSVATTQLTITEAAKTVTALNESETITLDFAETAQGYIHKANDIIDGAASKCIVDEEGAFEDITRIEGLIDKATTALKGE